MHFCIKPNRFKRIYSYFVRKFCSNPAKMDIRTFVFLDSETTGLPSMEHNRTKIIELCFTAVESNHLRLGAFPRIQNKLNLCFNPRKFINPDATKVTGLSNDLLENQLEFNESSFNLIKHFLSILQPPLCFVAHNGNRFDYPILGMHLNKFGGLCENILCADSLLLFRALEAEESRKKVEVVVQEAKEELPFEFQDGYDDMLCSLVDSLEGSPKKLRPEEVQRINETTPKKPTSSGTNYYPSMNGATSTKSTNSESQSRGKKIERKRLDFGRSSYKLGDVFSRMTSKQVADAHKAEYDVYMIIECAAVLGDRFVDWCNLNAVKFCDIPVMTPGKKIGT